MAVAGEQMDLWVNTCKAFFPGVTCWGEARQISINDARCCIAADAAGNPAARQAGQHRAQPTQAEWQDLARLTHGAAQIAALCVAPAQGVAAPHALA